MPGLFRRRGWFASIVITCLLVASLARAEDDTDRAAKNHFEAGRRAYDTGDYTGAVREFSAGYRLSQRPAFLLNLGQAYRKLNMLMRARRMYQRFLVEGKDEPRAQAIAKRAIAQLDGEIAEKQAQISEPETSDDGLPPPPGREPAPSPAPKPSPELTPRAEPNPLVIAPPASKPKRPIYKHPGLWVPIAIVVAGGIATGVALAYVYRSPWETMPEIGPGLR